MSCLLVLQRLFVYLGFARMGATNGCAEDIAHDQKSHLSPKGLLRDPILRPVLPPLGSGGGWKVQ